MASSDLFVTGIAASAGGINAMIELLSNASCHKSMCFVVVAHVRRFEKNEIASILERVSRLKAHDITDGMRLEHCGIYVIPPNQYVEMRDDKLHLVPRPEQAPNNCADHFFESLAVSYKSNAIGVVLSGSAVGSDGTEGVKAIKEAGGHTYAQDPETAVFPDMPKLAIASGAVDSVLSPKSIGHELSLISWAD